MVRDDGFRIGIKKMSCMIHSKGMGKV